MIPANEAASKTEATHAGGRLFGGFRVTRWKRIARPVEDEVVVRNGRQSFSIAHAWRIPTAQGSGAPALPLDAVARAKEAVEAALPTLVKKTSYFISLGIFLVFVLQGRQWLNPIPVGFDFLSKLVVGHADGVVVEGGEGLTPLPFGEIWRSLVSPLVFDLIALAVLFFYVGRTLTVEVRTSSKLLARISRLGGLTALAAAMMLSSTGVASAAVSLRSGDLQMAISLEHMAGRTGDSVEFKTVLTNTGTRPSPPVIVAMNIINLSKSGDVVDPEDWSPERTQYVDELAPGKSVTLPWTIDAVLDGNYMIYLVGIPQPAGPGASSQIATSPGLHLTIGAFSNLNPSGVLPYTIGVPFAVLALTVLMLTVRRRRVDTGGSEGEAEAPS